MRYAGNTLLVLGVLVGLLVPAGMLFLPPTSGVTWIALVGLAKLALVGSATLMTMGAVMLRRARTNRLADREAAGIKAWTQAGAAALMVFAAIAVLGEVAVAQSPRQLPDINGGLPAVSPDGERIAFVSTRGGSWDLYVASVDGRQVTRLTRDTLVELDPHWRGNEVVFSVPVGAMANPSSTIYTIRPDGTGRQQIGRAPGLTPRLSADGRSVLVTPRTPPVAPLLRTNLAGEIMGILTDSVGVNFNAAESPDGRFVAFARMIPPTEMGVWVAAANGKTPRAVLSPGTGKGAQWPAWSRDGGRLAVQVATGTPGQPTSSRIWITVDGSVPPREIEGPAGTLDETPSWFPDGRIAFQSNRTGRMEVWTMRPDGSDLRQFTR